MRGPITKGVTSIIGLSSEAYAHRKRKSQASVNDQGAPTQTGSSAGQLAPPSYPDAQKRSGSPAPSDYSDGSDYSDDEGDWIRDETQGELEQRPTTEVHSMDELVQNFLQRHPPPAYTPSAVSAKLPYPVIIPQKRPESKQRGFVRAYAPILADCGIDQATFLDFLDSFTTSIKGSRYFNTANVAIAASVMAYTVSMTPSVIVHISAAIVHTSIEAGRRLHQTTQANKFIDRMNDELFKPHGLYALLMSYDPNNAVEGQIFDMDASTTSAISKREGDSKSWTDKFHSASGGTHGEAQLPQSAPLVFPVLEAASEEQKANAFKRAGAFMQDYGDRKARAQFTANNPDSKLNVSPEPEFASRFSDPNHPVQQGGLLNMLSGGKLAEYKSGRREGRREQRGYDNAADRLRDRREQKYNTIGKGKSSKRGLKRVLAENVLYLMIVNMPTEAELEQAAKNEAKMKEEHAGIFGQ